MIAVSKLARRHERGLIQGGLGIMVLIAVLLCVLLIESCTVPQVSAEDRLFLNLSIDWIDRYTLPKQDFEGTPVGGISAIAYDSERDRLYALSDDRGRLAPSRFYTFKLDGLPDQLSAITVESVTLLRDITGERFPVDSLDPEGMALSPRNTLIISSEGIAAQNAPPRIMEFDLDSGQLIRELPVPQRYLRQPEAGDAEEGVGRGVQDNLGFEALTISGGASGGGWVDPFRLFVATEGPLLQDVEEDFAIAPKSRFLHYLLGESQSTLISEHIYPLEISPTGAVINGLSDIFSLDQAGHFLAIERAFGLRGFAIKLYQLATGVATDSSTLASASGDINGLVPIQKQPLLDLADLNIPLDNFEAITLTAPMGSRDQMLLLASDDNFDDAQTTDFLLFKLQISP